MSLSVYLYNNTKRLKSTKEAPTYNRVLDCVLKDNTSLLNPIIRIKDTTKPAENYFIVDIKVKQRYINPLVKTVCGSKRISEINKEAEKIIQDFLTFQDTKYGCVKLIY